MNESEPIFDQVVRALAELAIADPASVVPTLLIQDGVFLGHRYRYDGGCAMWWLGSPTLEFHDEQGKLLQVVKIERLGREAA